MSKARKPMEASPVEQEVLELVSFHVHNLEERVRQGTPYPDDAARAYELQRIAQLVHDRLQQRQAKAEQLDDDAQPDRMQEKLRLLKRFQDTLTTVQPDGSTMAEKAKDQKGVNNALVKGAALHAQLTAELEEERRLQAVADKAMEDMRDLLLLWKVQSTSPGSAGAQA